MTEDMQKDPSKMGPLEYADWAMRVMMGGWVPLRDYLRMFPGETQSKIDTRLHRKVWLRGVHYAVPPQSKAWVNLPAIRAWVESGGSDA